MINLGGGEMSREDMFIGLYQDKECTHIFRGEEAELWRDSNEEPIIYLRAEFTIYPEKSEYITITDGEDVLFCEKVISKHKVYEIKLPIKERNKLDISPCYRYLG